MNRDVEVGAAVFGRKDTKVFFPYKKSGFG
jgi:hypothetical protein